MMSASDLTARTRYCFTTGSPCCIPGSGGDGATGPTGPTGPVGATGPVGGTDQQIIFNSAGTASGTPNLLWNYSTNELVVDGKLTVTGIIDPTGLILTPQFADPSAGAATIWVDSATNRLVYGYGGLDVSGTVLATGVSSSGIITTAGLTSNGAITTNAALNAATIASTGLITAAGVSSSAGITATGLVSTGSIQLGGVTTTLLPFTGSNYVYYSPVSATATLPSSTGIAGQQFLFVNGGAPPGSTITINTTGGENIVGAGIIATSRTVPGFQTAIVTSMGSFGWAINVQ